VIVFSPYRSGFAGPKERPLKNVQKGAFYKGLKREEGITQKKDITHGR